MDHLVYLAASGAATVGELQAAVSHNLANLSTPGFKADLVRAESRYLAGGGLASRGFASGLRQGADLEPGPVQSTGRDLDVAVEGRGWIAVLGADGTEALSRRGDLRVDAFGQLTNGAGQLVLGNAGPVALPPYDAVAIGTDGTISIVPQGGDPNTQVAVDRIRLVDPDPADLVKGEDGLFRSPAPLQADAAVALTPGSLEGSNVSAIGGMVRMIELSRQFESQVRLISLAREMDTSSARLMSVE
ncbi:MAG: flagellar biosynthesis protein FlgF [Haliea sp.]|nr:flagellar biosynthesis protein FlgF [Haliea sp.]|tara:strand:+ start:311153 stop:311887 length:735 start_codon:yes stop_codon:yes gene_type:complete